MIRPMQIEGFYIRLAKERQHGGRVRSEFAYSPVHNCHIYLGRIFPIEQFQSIVPDVLDKYKNYEARAPYPVLVVKDYPNLAKARAAIKERKKGQQKAKE